MNTKTIGMWAFFAGMVLALVNVFVSLGDWAVQVMIVLGIIAGALHFFREDLLTLGVAYLALGAASSAMSELFAVGEIVTKIAAAWVVYLGPVVLTAFMIWGGAYLVTGRKK
ncbi:MAG TPA: hypothetical protein VJ965_11770 [Anaerolineales bacterium]|nr:hypothetical protein [Anaerolineales bacterium]